MKGWKDRKDRRETDLDYSMIHPGGSLPLKKGVECRQWVSHQKTRGLQNGLNTTTEETTIVLPVLLLYTPSNMSCWHQQWGWWLGMVYEAWLGLIVSCYVIRSFLSSPLLWSYLCLRVCLAERPLRRSACRCVRACAGLRVDACPNARDQSTLRSQQQHQCKRGGKRRTPLW